MGATLRATSEAPLAVEGSEVIGAASSALVMARPPTLAQRALIASSPVIAARAAPMQHAALLPMDERRLTVDDFVDELRKNAGLGPLVRTIGKRPPPPVASVGKRFAPSARAPMVPTPTISRPTEVSIPDEAPPGSPAIDGSRPAGVFHADNSTPDLPPAARAGGDAPSGVTLPGIGTISTGLLVVGALVVVGAIVAGRVVGGGS